jgi:cation:H+ antiporter
MEFLSEIWSLLVILLAAFIIGWAAETAQTFIPRALALSILAWLQTLPEFAVEATIAWNQERDLMIANLTGSLRLIIGLGLPMIFFVHFFFQGYKKRRFIKQLVLEDEDSLGILFLMFAVLYFVVILFKRQLTCWDSVILALLYFTYLGLSLRFPVKSEEGVDDLPWVGKKIVKLPKTLRIYAVLALFVLGGLGLQLSVHPFISTLQTWSVSLGISTFVFIQWVAPFLSEFPEKVSAFNWARQTNKAPMAVMNMVSSNINQWTLLAAMIPIVFSLSLGHFEPVVLDVLHRKELALTIAQSILAGLLLLDLRFTLIEALLIFILWVTQFVESTWREPITVIYLGWSAVILSKYLYGAVALRKWPAAVTKGAPYLWFGKRERPLSGPKGV